MREMFQTMGERLEKGENLVMVTVIDSKGAAPRGSVAHMLVGTEGRCYGTVGGGAVEYRAQRMAQEMLDKKQSAEKYFSLTKDDVENLGMVCGGDVRIYFS